MILSDVFSTEQQRKGQNQLNWKEKSNIESYTLARPPQSERENMGFNCSCKLQCIAYNNSDTQSSTVHSDTTRFFFHASLKYGEHNKTSRTKKKKRKRKVLQIEESLEGKKT